MPTEFSPIVILMIGGALLLGWILGSISARFGKNGSAGERDPREKQILSLEAELRVAKADATLAIEKRDTVRLELTEKKEGIEKRDNVIAHQQETVAQLRKDLKDSVVKTRQLREELTHRATENVKSEAKLREVETELSVVQASSEMISTGVLDYSLAPNDEEQEADTPEEDRRADG